MPAFSPREIPERHRHAIASVRRARRACAATGASDPLCSAIRSNFVAVYNSPRSPHQLCAPVKADVSVSNPSVVRKIVQKIRLRSRQLITALDGGWECGG